MCVIFIAWQGKMTRNSHSIARHFNAAMKSIGHAVRPKSQSLWVYTPPTPPLGGDIQYFTLWCQWLASRQLRDGLLGDLVDPAIGDSPGAARQYIRETLFLATWIRAKEKILSLIWLDRYL